MSEQQTLTGSATSRRNMLRTSGFAGAAAAALATGISMPARADTTADVDVYVLNFALNLEYLEAEYYLLASTGAGLKHGLTTGLGTHGRVSGGHLVNFATPMIGQFIAEVANDELNHVTFLRKSLGAYAEARPRIDFKKSFAALGALIGVPGFDPFNDELSFLLGAYVFEDVGVTAYSGAAPLITDKGYLAAAAGILAVEAYHAGAIRGLLYEAGAAQQTVDISAVRAAVSGVGDQGVVVNGAVNIVDADSNSIAFARTPAEVLDIVYLGSAATPGGFFPDGVNLPAA